MVEDLISQALSFYKTGNKQKAGEILKCVVKDDPQNFDAWFGLALCLDNSDQQRYCLNKVLAIRPDHQKAKQLLNRLPPEKNTSLFQESSIAALSHQQLKNEQKFDPANLKTVSVGSVEFIPANCPNCGGELRVPENRKVVKCMYCGHDVIIHDPTTLQVENKVNIETLLKLAKLAENGENYAEAYNYYTKVLEAEPENISALLGKGLSAGLMSSLNSLRYSEAQTLIQQVTQNLQDIAKVAGNDFKNSGDLNEFMKVFEPYHGIAETVAKYLNRIAVHISDLDHLYYHPTIEQIGSIPNAIQRHSVAIELNMEAYKVTEFAANSTYFLGDIGDIESLVGSIKKEMFFDLKALLLLYSFLRNESLTRENRDLIVKHFRKWLKSNILSEDPEAIKIISEFEINGKLPEL